MTGKKILFVDDKPNLLKLGTAIFEAGGYEIIGAGDGAEALELLEVHDIALLITDILMPNMDGYTLCYTIRNGEKHRDLPIIVYSATYTTKDDGVLADEVGADMFIRKPASMSYLLEAAKEVIDRPRKTDYTINRDRALADVTRLYNTRLIDKLEDKNLQLDSAQTKLVKSEAKFRALVENSLDLISMIDEGGKIIYQSPAAKKMLGYEQEDAHGKNALSFFHPDEHQDIAARLHFALANPGLPISRTNRMKHKDGHYIWTEGTTTNLLHDPNIRAFVGNFRDVTERREAWAKIEDNERRLEAERKKYADLFTQAPSYICILAGPDHIYEMANPLYLQITGKKDIIGKAAVEVFPELVEQGFVALLDQIYNTGIPYAANEVLISFKNDDIGTIVDHYMNFVYQPYRDLDGKVEGIFFFANVVTEQVAARQKIEQTEKYFRALVENADDIITLADSRGNFIYISPSFEKITGYSVTEMIGKSYSSFIHPDFVEESITFFKELMANPGVSTRRSGCFIHKNGTHVWLEGTAINLQQDENVGGVVSNLRDITLRRQAEEKIEHANRMFSFLSHINQAIVHLADDKQLFKEACRIAFEIGKFRMAWIGLLDNENTIVSLVESMGMPDEDIPLFTNAVYQPGGGVGDMMRTKASFVCNNIKTAPGIKEWYQYADNRQLKALMILPLKLHGEIIATFNLYAGEEDFFDKQEVDLLEEVANDISFALDVFEKERVRKEMEAKVQHNELRLKQAQSIAHIGSWDYDLTTGKVVWSEEACRIYGIDLDKSIQGAYDWEQYCHPDDLQQVREIVSQGESTLSRFSFNHRIILKDGTLKHIFSETHFEFDSNGNLAGIHGIVHDVTTQKEAEEKINNANRLYAFISQVNQTIVQVTNEEALFKAVCSIAIEQGKFDLAWISMPGVEDRSLNVVAHCNATESDIALLNGIKFSDNGPIARVMNTGRLFVINDFLTGDVAVEFKNYAAVRGFRSCIVLPITKGGKTIGAYNLISAKANLFDEEEIRLLTEATNDISFALDVFEKEKHRQEMERKIVQSEMRLIHAQGMAHVGSWDIDFKTGEVVWSEEACRIFGINIAERYNQTFESFISHVHPEDLARVLEITGEMERTFKGNSFHHRIIRKNGEVRLLLSEALYNFDSDGIPTGLTGVVHDVTEARAAEASLARSEENLRLIMDIIPHSIYVKNYDGKYVFVNKTFASLYGLTPIDVINKYVNDILPGEVGLEAFLQEDRQVMDSGKMRIIPEQGFVDHTGIQRLFYTIKVPFIVAGTNEQAVLEVAMDITDQKAAEIEKAVIINDIVQRNKNLEQFSYIVSHNLRAPVANIIGLTDVVVDSELEIDIKNKLTADLTASVKKLDNVIMDLNYILQVKHTESKQKENVSLSAILNDIQLSVENLIRSNDVQIITDFSAIGELFTLKSYLYSIIYNLVSNSIKYRRADVPPVLHIASKLNGSKIVLTFEDNGLGIDLTRRKDEVFGLYKRFHTHVSGKGMGLFMVRTQVESIGGTIAIESEVNKGTTFTIEFDIN